MKRAKHDERKQSLEVATYANSLRLPLRRCGIFLRGDKTAGVLLPPEADIELYERAVKDMLATSGLNYIVALVRVSKHQGETDSAEAQRAVASSKSVIVLMAHGANPPPELSVALDRIEQVGAVKPYHLVLAAKSVFGLEIDREHAVRLFSYPLSVVFSAIKGTRPIEVTLEKLEGSAKVKEIKRSVSWEPTIEQLAGYGKATEWALDLIEDITAWRQGEIDWRDVDGGLLISGPPGCGKTLFASAVARSCGATLVTASSAQWQAKGHLGDMLRAMRASFKEAIEAAPSILFIDEFDSFGSRAHLKGENAAYGLQVINALLELLDGASGRDGVVVIAATNRPDDIDEALRRPGRLDRHIQVEMPDLEAREQILSAHLGLAIPADEMRTIALATSGYSGAALRQLVRDARRIARKNRRTVCGGDFLSIVPPVETLSENERWAVCVHEAGHAIVGMALGTGEIEAIVVARQAGHRDRSLGHVEWRRSNLRNRTIQMYRNEIAMLLGARAAEHVILGEIHEGSGGMQGSDLHRAADIATVLIGGHGVNGLGYTNVSASRDLDKLRASDAVMRMHVESLLSEELARAEGIIRQQREDTMAIASALMGTEVLSGAAAAQILRPDAPLRRREG